MNGSDQPEAAKPQSIDLNADLGEGFPNDRPLLDLVTSASICCGAHAGSPLTIRETLRQAVARDVRVGAHPGYPDRENFGRREQHLTTLEVSDLIKSQLDILMTLAAEEGADVLYVKPHGALYNQAQREPDVARAVVAAARDFGLPLLGQPGSLVEAEARECELVYIAEGFPDRRYRPDGSLALRSEPGAVLREPARYRRSSASTSCTGASRNALHPRRRARRGCERELVRQILKRHGIAIRPFVDDQG